MRCSKHPKSQFHGATATVYSCTRRSHSVHFVQYKGQRKDPVPSRTDDEFVEEAERSSKKIRASEKDKKTFRIGRAGGDYTVVASRPCHR